MKRILVGLTILLIFLLGAFAGLIAGNTLLKQKVSDEIINSLLIYVDNCEEGQKSLSLTRNGNELFLMCVGELNYG